MATPKSIKSKPLAEWKKKEVYDLSEDQLDLLIAHWKTKDYFRGSDNATTIELKREIVLYVRDKAKKGKNGLDEKKDWRPKAEREKLTLERKRARQEKLEGDGVPPAVPAAPTPVAAKAGGKKKAPAKGRGGKKKKEENGAKEDGAKDGVANGSKTDGEADGIKGENGAEDGAATTKKRKTARKGAGKKK